MSIIELGTARINVYGKQRVMNYTEYNLLNGDNTLCAVLQTLVLFVGMEILLLRVKKI